MKQVLQNRNGVTVVRDVPAPPCPSGGVLVRNAFSVISSGTERSRVELSKQSLLGKARARPDLVKQVIDTAKREGMAATRRAVQSKLSTDTPIGYSSAGVVIEVGAQAAGLVPGEIVACGGDHAAHAEIVAVPRNLVARVPEGVSLEDAALSTIAAVALHGIRLVGVDLGSRAAVIGCGLIGQIACRLLSAAGAEVIAVDVDPMRVQDAMGAGADRGWVSTDAAVRVAELTGGVGVDSVLVTAAASRNDPLLLAAEIARDRGSVVLVGAVPIELPREPLYAKELNFRISRSYGPGRYDVEYEERGLDYPIGYVRWTEQRNMEAILSLVARGRLSFDGLIDDVVPVDDAVSAYERLVANDAARPRGAILIRYPEVSESRPQARPAIPKRPSADTLRVALIGPGSFAAKVLVPALVAAGASLELSAGGTGPSAEAATRKGFARFAESADDAIVDDAVDAVIISTRHADHARLAAAALDAGKHVFVEKPLALTHDELELVLEAARRSTGILVVGFNRRFAPFVRDVRDALAAGSGPMSAHYRVSAGHIDPEHWVHDLEQGGGRLIGEGCHFVDTLRFLAGSPVTDVYANAFGPPSTPVQAYDNAAITLRFADGAVGTILYAAEGGRGLPKERLEAFRAGATGVIDDFKSVDLYRGSGHERKKSRTQDKGHRAEVQAFVDGVRSGEPPVPLDELENVSLATLAIVDSLRAGTVVRLRGD